MKPRALRLALASLILALTVPSFAQDAPTQSSEAVQAQRFFAVTLLRNINTSEVTYKYKHSGSYASWDALLASAEFPAGKVIAQLAKHDPQVANAQFSSAPGILPGWLLRLNVTADGQAYDLMLQGKTDTCAVGAFTNESGVIWLAQPLGCESEKKTDSAGTP